MDLGYSGCSKVQEIMHLFFFLSLQDGVLTWTETIISPPKMKQFGRASFYDLSKWWLLYVCTSFTAEPVFAWIAKVCACNILSIMQLTTVRNYRHVLLLLLLKVMYFITSVYVVIVPTPYPFLFNIILVTCTHVHGYAHCS